MLLIPAWHLCEGSVSQTSLSCSDRTCRLDCASCKAPVSAMGLFCPFFGPAKAFTNVKDTGHDIIRRPFYFCFKPAQCQSGSHWGNFLGNLFLSSKEGMSAEISFLKQEKKINFVLLSQKAKGTDEKYLYDTDMREGKSKTLPRPRLTEVTALLGRPLVRVLVLVLRCVLVQSAGVC